MTKLDPKWINTPADPLCENCKQPRSLHYERDGSWRQTQKCTEYRATPADNEG